MEALKRAAVVNFDETGLRVAGKLHWPLFRFRTLGQGKGRPKNTPGRNLLRRLQQHEDAVLAFALVEDIPFTNNLAERDLRPAKVKQKVSGCFRTVLGAEVYARLQAIMATCGKQGRNIFATLRDIFSCQPVSLMATQAVTIISGNTKVKSKPDKARSRLAENCRCSARAISEKSTFLGAPFAL